MLPLNNGKVTSGVETFTAFYKETTTWHIIGCNLAGIVAGLCICLLTEYFTS
jgi:Na+/H+-translocating membrane pyrophosphatase